MSDPSLDGQSLTGMLPTGAFGNDPADPGTGQGEDVPTDDIQREDEPDPDPAEIEPGQD